ncbi:DUF805 domain-containing protein [Streptococcus rubneri]|uniref:DUF805 domain-containing protein n=1 Tax=Streptococcus rubneri TaxID=1234680 RepID=A0A4Z1DSH3_9STRE|nr:DUF805 domain-containing protein [Streptococcus rubneri]MBK4774917.1 DUF805 domain-containing protein [Streptococcus rubneri]TGN91562.1 DUF805 domain-containing protein [Streptococcus rubneri]
MKSLRLFWMQYADFTRVSDRKDFWISQLWHLLFTSPFWMYELVRSSATSNQTDQLSSLQTMGLAEWLAVFFLLYVYLAFVPQQAIVVRRLRDAGFHWSLILLFWGPIFLYLLSPIQILLVLVGAAVITLAILLSFSSVGQQSIHEEEQEPLAPSLAGNFTGGNPSNFSSPQSFSSIPNMVSAPLGPVEKAPLEQRIELEEQNSLKNENEVAGEHASNTDD